MLSAKRCFCVSQMVVSQIVTPLLYTHSSNRLCGRVLPILRAFFGFVESPQNSKHGQNTQLCAPNIPLFFEIIENNWCFSILFVYKKFGHIHLFPPLKNMISLDMFCMFGFFLFCLSFFQHKKNKN